MFKPLLKTIPSLSGNMKIVCKLEGYDIDNKNSSIYNCNVNEAYLTSISNNLYDKNIKINLKNNDFEYDVKKFYLYYNTIFYNTNFKYSKTNIPILDTTSILNDSNQDFKYGCKRVSYKKSGNTFAYFAPIYVDDINDFKGKYFVITCTFNNGVSKLTRFIKVKISNINEGNYIADYLSRYISKIDSQVINCSSSYKNIYHGIDLKHGGFIKVEDNISSNLYNKYYTINDFDAIICQGFKRNNIMMKQILALSFYFNVDSLLYEFERHIYYNSDIFISGQWYNEDNKEIPFYDFSDNYTYYNEDIFILYDKNTFKYVDTSFNIMNMKYPACNESMSDNYKYVNTVAKNYTRWKLKYSNDEYPYIINNNYAFSANKKSLFSYKEFPSIYSPIRAYAKLISNTEYNLLFDFDDIKLKDNITVINNKDIYYDYFNQKHINNFFDLIVKYDNSEKYIDIFEYEDYWSNVDKDGKVYHKGILYDLNSIYNENLRMNYKIDKFGVFVIPTFSFIHNNEFNDTYKRAKFLFSSNFESNDGYYNIDKIYNYYEMNTKSSYMYNDVLVIEDPNGDYVDTATIEYKQYDYNKYYDLNDIIILFKYLINTNISDSLENNDHADELRFDNIFKEYIYTDDEKLSLDMITGYKVIDVYNVSNIYGEYFEDIIYEFNDKYSMNEDHIIFRNQKYLEYEDIYNWGVNKLYFSIWPNKTKYSLIKNYSLLSQYKEKNNRIVLYIKTNFIKDNEDNKRYLEEYLIRYLGNINKNIDCLNLLNNLDKYYYSNGLYGSYDNIKLKYTDGIFKKIDDIENNYGVYSSNNDKNIIYVDPYNMCNVYKSYKGEVFPEDIQKDEFYCNFLNIDHIRIYFNKLYKNENLQNDSNITDKLIANIFIKIKTFNNINLDLDDDAKTDISTIIIKDEYINIGMFGFGGFDDISKYISYDSKLKCFYFNENYKNDFLSKIKENTLDKNISDILKYYNVIKFEICFKKKMMKLDENLYKLIIHRTNNEIFKDLYLYHLYDPKDYLCPMNYHIWKYNQLTDILKTFYNIGIITETNSEPDTTYDKFSLYPYFNSVYEEGQTETKIYSDYFINNIIGCNNGTYRYNEQSINFLANIPQKYNIGGKRYSVVNNIEDRYITASELLESSEDNPHGLGIISDKDNIDENSYLITYWYKGTYYGFYMISSYFDNTQNTVNIQNEDLEYINCVDYIDNIHVDMINQYSYSYLSNIYNNILPYSSNTNPAKFIIINSNTLVKPHNYNLKNNIKQYPNKDNNGLTYSYTLYYSEKPSYIELSRYFDNIIPYIPEAKYLYSYSLYYKNTNKYIENDLYNMSYSYIMQGNKHDITKYTYIAYFTNDNNVSYHIPVEYKYYNANKFLNINKEIILDIHKEFTEKELIEFENDKDNIFKLFTEYINIDRFDSLPDIDKYNNYLFLYKKYEVSFLHDFKYINESNNKVYSLSIKFNLL